MVQDTAWFQLESLIMEHRHHYFDVAQERGARILSEDKNNVSCACSENSPNLSPGKYSIFSNDSVSFTIPCQKWLCYI